MKSAAEVSSTIPEVEYDFSTTLVKASTTYENLLGSEWVLFAPDWPGWPVVVDDTIHELLDKFRTPAKVGVVLGAHDLCDTGLPDRSGLDSFLDSVAFLEEQGFLRVSPAEPYPQPRHPVAPKTVSVWLHVTDACNLDCAYCFVAKKDSVVMPASVSAATANALARTAITHGIEKITVKFAGGEPTLVLPAVEHFAAQVEASLAGTQISIHFALLSNGTLINDRVIEFLRRSNSSISISLDGYGDTHDIYRRTKAGEPTWNKIAKNFDLLQRHGINPFVMATVSDLTRHGLPELARWIFSRGLRTRLSVVRECGTENKLAAYARRIAESFDETFAVLEAEEIVFDPRSDLEICELRFNQPAYWVACGIGSNHLVVKPDGSLASCPMTIDGPGVPAGADMLEACHRTFPFMPTTARTGTDGTECLSCRWFTVCAGGCPVNNQKTRGHPFARSPLCVFYQAVIPRYLEFFGRKLQQFCRAEVRV